MPLGRKIRYGMVGGGPFITNLLVVMLLLALMLAIS